MSLIQLEQKFAITELLHRYNRTIDRLDFEGWANCFTRDGVFEGAYKTFKPHDDIEAFKAMSLSIMHDAPNMRHFVTNIMIELDGQMAKCESFLLLTSTDFAVVTGAVPESRIIQAGVYIDDLAIDGQEWRIRNRRVQMDGAARGQRPVWVGSG